MKNGKYAKHRGVASKTLALVVVMMLVIGCTIGGTIAWLTDETDSVTNTFTVGDINITLAETYNKDTNDDKTNDAWEGKMVPGNTLSKDPKVTVTAGSEDCWLFVKVEKSGTLDKYIAYAMAGGWTALDETKNPGVYYYNGTITQGTPISILGAGTYTNDQNDTVTWNADHVGVKPEVTKSDMETLNAAGATQPTLTFTAYAVQKDNIADAATAWSKLPANP